MVILMEIFDGLEAILTIITEFLYNKAFDKNKKILKRLPYIIIYILLLVLIVFGLSFLGIILIKNKQELLVFFCVIISGICVILLIVPFLKK